MNKRKRFLFVSPHPDDAELAIGGTILKLKKQGHKVFLADLTSGEPTPYGTEEKRKKESMAADRILKIDRRYNLRLENRYLFDDLRARRLLAEKIRLIRPDILFCPFDADAHPDHVSASRIAEAARFYAKFSKVRMKGKPHYPPLLLYFFPSHLRVFPKASFFVDISLEFKAKMKAVRAYRSQFVDNPNNRFVFDYIESMNEYFGHLIRSRYAEPLFSREVLKLDDLSSLL
ncbi:MAG: PIG-L family deacetylase [Candidatus Aureabacteria bacterium]|nr:PIG-L family deacetylase [Candidatus Auribacterota bacterium]